MKCFFAGGRDQSRRLHLHKEAWPRGPGVGMPLEGAAILRFQFELPKLPKMKEFCHIFA